MHVTNIFTTLTLLLLIVIAAPRSTAAAISGNATSTRYHLSSNLTGSRRFSGLGGLSGGGGTSVLLWAYPERERNEILDYLFKPNFGASLQILKVEIGGDAQSTDGSEPSVMHSFDSVDPNVGYEFWLCREAKKRNKNIKLYALPWAFPAWPTCAPGSLENCTTHNNPYKRVEQLIKYILMYLSVARDFHALEFDYLGDWNERTPNTTYLEELRTALDGAGFAKTQLVVPDDAGWAFAETVLADETVAKLTHAIGSHYPGTTSTRAAKRAADELGKELWASEDFSTYNSAIGAGCIARIANMNFVTGHMSATILWNLVASYEAGLKWVDSSVMTARTPWGGGSYGKWRVSADGSATSWSAGPTLWAVAHTTQFTVAEAGRQSRLLRHASGQLSAGGSYVAYLNPPAATQRQQRRSRSSSSSSSSTSSSSSFGSFSIVIEKMSRDHSSCVRPVLPFFETADEVARFDVQELFDAIGAPVDRTILYLFETHFAFYPGDETSEFISKGKIDVVDGRYVTLPIRVGSILTLTTLADAGHKGSPSSSSSSSSSFQAAFAPPSPSLFPRAYVDSFEDCQISREAKYFTSQNGAFECKLSGDEQDRHQQRGIVMQQRAPLKPITWGGDLRPHSYLGHHHATDASFTVDAFMTAPGASVMLGVRNIKNDNSQGIIFGISDGGVWGVWLLMSEVDPTSGGVKNALLSGDAKAVTSGGAPRAGEWWSYRVDVNASFLNIWIKKSSSSSNSSSSWLHLIKNATFGALMPTRGFAMIGTKAYGEFTQFDNVALYLEYAQCKHNNGKLTTSTAMEAAAAAAPSVGDKICVVECNAEVGVSPYSVWSFPAVANQRRDPKSSTISLRAWPHLCLRATPPSSSYPSSSSPSSLRANRKFHKKFKQSQQQQRKGRQEEHPYWLELAPCNASDGLQQFEWFLDGIAPDSERQSFIYTRGRGGGEEKNEKNLCLDIYQQKADICNAMDAWECNTGENQAFFYDYDSGQIGNQATATCVGVC